MPASAGAGRGRSNRNHQDQLKQPGFLNAPSSDPGRIAHFWLAMTIGARGALCALVWEDVDLERGRSGGINRFQERRT
jgi:hypothetical protein